MKKTIIILAVVAMMACAVSAMAALTDFGPGIPIGSWTQPFNETGVGPFDGMKFLMLGGYQFEGPGLAGLPGGWSFMPGGNTAFMTASGPAVTNSGNFNINFLPNSNVPISFYFQALNATSILESALADWNGSSWKIRGIQWDGSDPSVPEPMSILLGIMGLSSIAGFRKLRRN